MSTDVIEDQESIGCEDAVIEIDERKLGRRKYNRENH